MISDREIVILLKGNHKNGFNSLYDKYGPMLYGWINSLTNNIVTASKILKNSFLEICMDISLFDPLKTTLFTWMLHITMKNFWLEFHPSPEDDTEKIKNFLNRQIANG